MRIDAARLLLGIALLTGCGTGIRDIEGFIPPAGGAPAEALIQAEIRELDPRAGLIYIRTRTGEDGSVHYDGRTRIVYLGQRVPALALQHGDSVELQMERTTENDFYAIRIEVLARAADRARQ